jgi:GrpB-like predicted nucleotidyltransferase (UPF0157 family)
MDSPPPVVIPHEPDWEQRANELIASVGGVFGDRAIRLDHIGSTAIPCMPAKDVIDLQVSAVDLDEVARACDGPLADLGFSRTPYEHDHVPAGRTDRPADWEKRLWARRGSIDGDANLHLRRPGSPNERVALLFRDWFRAHPQAVPSYGSFKVALAASVTDLDVYTEVKDPIVDLVIVVAEAWAESTGWRP